MVLTIENPGEKRIPQLVPTVVEPFQRGTKLIRCATAPRPMTISRIAAPLHLLAVNLYAAGNAFGHDHRSRGPADRSASLVLRTLP